MKIRFIEDGNLSSWVRLLLILTGIGFAAIAIGFDLPVVWARILLLVGFAIALVGGMTSRAKILHIKPFGNSYKRARRSYEVKGDEQDKS
ncbi:hypothetical protein WJ21_26255 [Burkholderia vietnamiensis]|uniref:hypothetical protein n=1 Tax=Burkholderia vietnamiensis TaxID=60552 RepID=UPI00075B5CD2|nr:hypothetical protein [Burkholderia vietnamiensis]KVF93658.1 hypothetical protein WJ21_26255 [Burkholderia vietnamiensis]